MESLRFTSIFFLFICYLSINACSNVHQQLITKDDETEVFTNKNKQVLIVYLSRTQNTKAVAQMIQQMMGGELVELALQNPYPQDYRAIVAQVQKENETGFLPVLKTKIENIHQYDTIFLGFPTWGMQLPPPMKSFLKQYDLKGKTIIPFNTNAGYGVGSGFESIKQLCIESKILTGFSVEGGKERDGVLFVMKGEKEVMVREQVKKWLGEIKML